MPAHDYAAYGHDLPGGMRQRGATAQSIRVLAELPPEPEVVQRVARRRTRRRTKSSAPEN